MGRNVAIAALTAALLAMGAAFWRFNLSASPLALAGLAFCAAPVCAGEAMVAIARRRARMRAAIRESSPLYPLLTGPWLGALRALELGASTMAVLGWLVLTARPEMLGLCALASFLAAFLCGGLITRGNRHFHPPYAMALAAGLATGVVGLAFLGAAFAVQMNLTVFSGAIAGAPSLEAAAVEGIRAAPRAQGWLREVLAYAAALDAAALWLANRDELRGWGLTLLALQSAVFTFTLARASAVAAALFHALAGRRA